MVKTDVVGYTEMERDSTFYDHNSGLWDGLFSIFSSCFTQIFGRWFKEGFNYKRINYLPSGNGKLPTSFKVVILILKKEKCGLQIIFIFPIFSQYLS